MCDVLENVADEYQIFIDVLSIVSPNLFILRLGSTDTAGVTQGSPGQAEAHHGGQQDNFQNVDIQFCYRNYYEYSANIKNLITQISIGLTCQSFFVAEALSIHNSFLKRSPHF